MSPHSDSTSGDVTDDTQLFEVLDRYVDSLHRRDTENGSRVLEQRPDLSELLKCLHSLDQLGDAVASAADQDVDPGGPTWVPGLSGTMNGPEVSESFGKFVLQDEIGRGGMGVVFKALQTDLDRMVAVKMILANRLASAEEIRRFQLEARAAGRLTHPNIVGIHEFGEVHGQHYFAMDYVEGKSLAEILQEGPVAPERAAQLMATVARAVDYLHRHDVIHRDLKPSNILVDAHDCPYVTDFGLAKIYESGSEPTRSGTIIGTPSYMSPEQAAGRTAEVSPASDIYSLGAILYELLTGLPPFKEATPLDTLVQVLEGEPTLPRKLVAGLPRELELICLKCLEKEVSARYSTAADLADDLERHLQGESVAAHSGGMVVRLRRWARREPALASHWAALLATAGVVQTNYFTAEVDWNFHLQVMSVLGVWAIVSWGFQQLLHLATLAETARFGWIAADGILLTWLLFLSSGPLGPLVVGYPLLIAAAGLFFRVRLVWFMTVVSLVSYAVLMWLRPEEAEPRHYPLVFAAILAVMGFVIAYQVHRVRVLSRYYENRRLP